MAAEQHVPAAVALLGDEAAEDLLHERVEPRGGLVEDEELDVAGEGRDESDLLPVAP